MSKHHSQKDLFAPLVPEARRNPHFEQGRTWGGAEPGRLMMNEIYSDFHDADGNFAEQFQTTGFDARTFELYLYAYLSRSGYSVSRNHPQPDFIVTRNGARVAIEATTVNPRAPIPKPDLSSPPPDLSPEELAQKLENELPIRFGSPLFSKLQMRYWELEHCKDLPLIFAIEAFHESFSLGYSSSPLANYLYGLHTFPKWTEEGELYTEDVGIKEHRHGQKIIPSRFFGQPDTEHVSAVIFSNSGTWPKFQRMGFQAGYHRGNIIMIRRGTCFNPDRNSATPLRFKYSLHNPPGYEPWGQGLVVLRNPNAIHPLPPDFFINAAVVYFDSQGRITTDTPRFHPFASFTEVHFIEDPVLDPNVEVRPSIRSILLSEFNALGITRFGFLPSAEMEWFASNNRRVIGTVVLDLTDEDWLYVLFSRHSGARPEVEDVQIDIKTRREARERLLDAMEQMICDRSRE